MDIFTLAFSFYIVLVFLGLITIWMQFPGTMLVLGAALIYDLFTRSIDIPWQAYLIMFSLLALGEVLDVILSSYYKKSPKMVSFVKTLCAVGMIVVFMMTL
ncbi:MAG: hypothetical protein ACE5DM_02025 [Candidatus Nanoarchaeia archaeon]